MRPVKAKSLYEKYAGVAIPVENLSLINDFYWKTIKKHLSNLTAPVILLTGLGQMEIKPWMIPTKLKKLQAGVQKWGNKLHSPIKDNYQCDLIQITRILEQITAAKEKHQEIKNQRKLWDLPKT